MPRANRPPSYHLHKARICAVAIIDVRNRYLGPHGSLGSYEKYARPIANRKTGGVQQQAKAEHEVESCRLIRRQDQAEKDDTDNGRPN